MVTCRREGGGGRGVEGRESPADLPGSGKSNTKKNPETLDTERGGGGGGGGGVRGKRIFSRSSRQWQVKHETQD